MDLLTCVWRGVAATRPTKPCRGTPGPIRKAAIRMSAISACRAFGLRLLYPPHSPHRYNPDDDTFYQPLRDEPVAADGNLYPPNSKLRPELPNDEDLFVEVPRDVYYDPAVPGHWWVIPSKIEMIG